MENDPSTPSTAPRLKVLLAAPRGYCAGVDRAVKAVEEALSLWGAPVYVRKQIVHNRHVVARLARAGAVFVEELSEVPEGAVCVFSAHGVAPSVHTEAAARSLTAIDATCPLVTKVHFEARRFAKEDYDIVLIGHEGHEEVVGTSGQAPEHLHLVQGPEEAAGVQVRDESRVAYLSQTTLSVDETEETVNALRARFPLLTGPPSADICYATQNRQDAVKLLAGRAEVVLVCGSQNSSNTLRLVEVAREGGSEAYLIDDADELETAWLVGAETVGVTSGASVPEDLVEALLARLAQLGYDDVEDVVATRENVTFALPQELSRERKRQALLP